MYHFLKKHIVIGLLFSLYLIVIFYKFTHIPGNLSIDEVLYYAKMALALNGRPYTPFSLTATGQSTVYFYIILFSFKTFGVNSFALRFPSAIFGAVDGILIYLILRQIFRDKITIIVTTFIFFTLRWHFNFARFSFEATFLLCLEMTSVYLLFKFLEKKATLYVVFSSIFAGFAFYSYYPGKLFFLLPGIWLFFHASKKYFLLYVLIVVCIISPLLWFGFKHPDVRVSQISFLSDPKLTVEYKMNGVTSNILKTILMPFWKGDMNGRHNFPGKPALNPILGILLLLGIFLIFFKPSSSSRVLGRGSINPTLFFLSYLIISIIPTLLTSPNDNPSMLRTFTAIPASIYFIGSAIHTAISWKKKYILSTLIALILLSSAYELRTYFQFQSRVFRNSFELTCPLYEMVKEDIIPKKCRVKNNLF